jgi:short-subunit dehydrogenase
MAVSLKPLRKQVIVITGASSGIGLATAREAARLGARVVMAARNGEALAQIEREINAAGGRAIHVVADVSRREDVRRVADAAVRVYGGFDTWVNNAGEAIYGKLEQISDDDHRRLFDVNYWGVVYGSLVAVEHLKRRGGALINLGSEVSEHAIPELGAYAASKHAVMGFTDALRMELQQEGAPVSVTLIKPSGIDTPFPQHARNYMDREPRLPDPAYTPGEVANAILHAAVHPEREIYVGASGRLSAVLAQFTPKLFDWIGSHVMGPQQKRSEPPRDPAGALRKPGRDGRERGEHPGVVMPTSVYTRASLHPALTALLLAGAGVGVLACVDAMRSRRR